MPRKIIDLDLINEGPHGIYGSTIPYSATVTTPISTYVDATITGSAASVLATVTATLSNYIRKDGATAMTGPLTLLAAAPTLATHAANKAYVDSLLASVSWIPPADVFRCAGNFNFSGTGPDPAMYDDGICYIVNNWGAGFNDGDIVQNMATPTDHWAVVIPAASVTAGVRMIMDPSPTGSPFTGKDNMIAQYDGANWGFTAPVDANAVFIKSGYYDSMGFVYDSVNKWLQFSGAGQINVTAPITKSWNTLGITQAGTTTDGYVTAAQFNSKMSELSLPANGLSYAGPTLSLGVASASITGALGGTDWITFNNKLPGTLTNTPASNHLTSGILVNATATVTMAFGDVGYINAAGYIAIANATISTSASAIYMCADASINYGASGNWLLLGMARNDSWNWTVGGKIYLSDTGTTGNTLSQTTPTLTNHVVQIMGLASATNCIYFKPELTQIELV